MKKNVMIVVIVLVIVTTALMYLFQGSNTLKPNGDNLPDETTAPEKSPKKGEELFDLKSSIGNVIDDSVEEEIQKAVEDEVLKTTAPKK